MSPDPAKFQYWTPVKYTGKVSCKVFIDDIKNNKIILKRGDVIAYYDEVGWHRHSSTVVDGIRTWGANNLPYRAEETYGFITPEEYCNYWYGTKPEGYVIQIKVFRKNP